MFREAGNDAEWETGRPEAERGAVPPLPDFRRWDDVKPLPPLSADRRPDTELPIEDLIARSAEAFRRLEAANADPIHTVRVTKPGPFGLVVVGDPHIDSPGCNWPALLRWVEMACTTEGVYGINIGDTVDNWVGRLVRLYAESETTRSDGWRLTEWFFHKIVWLAILRGNHCEWNDGPAVMKLLARNAQIMVMQAHGAKIRVVPPRGEPLHLHIAHDFPGSSQWNDTHGPLKASVFDPWADVYACGHRHIWGVQRREGRDGRVRLLMRVRGFKQFDDHAASMQLHEQKHGHAIALLCDPEETRPTERIREVLDPDVAADMLAWMRRRRLGAAA